MADLAKMGFKGRTADAAALVLNQGYTQYRAAKTIGVDQAAVSRMLKKIRERTGHAAQ